MTPSPVEFVDRIPTPAEHRTIAEAVGWTHAFDWDTMDASLAGSTAGVVAVRDGRAIGMGRLVGDGVKYFYVQDLAVVPEAQGEGLGARLLDHLLAWVADHAPSHAFVGLFATAEGDALYRSRGFERGDMAGMFRIVAPTERS
ncbi:GNAT family N-acetyltransferase [Microbacterium sp. NPDC058062]|uniref:GNAT family N-acetyltransferase n=1 Tax=Microbacterium sp. NPDC058062 TaxID=3346320 RepID=UPI0036DF87B5